MSALKLDKETIEWTIGHILTHGDTDIFPYPVEFSFLADRKDEIALRLSEENLHTYRPMGLLESLVPKGRYSFRLGHQVSLVDCIIFTSAVVTTGRDLERFRIPYNENIAFAYRFSPDADCNIFRDNCRYKDWLLHQWSELTFGEDYTHVIKTDISDFYQRTYHHRLENCLDQATSSSPFAKFILRILKDWRVRQSFGLPVGGNAARLLAEVVLNDTDHALSNQGYNFARYVDDFCIFVKEGQDPYGILAFLAEHLAVNERLTLSAPKTKIVTAEEYLSELSTESGEDDEQTLKSITERLYLKAYETDELDEEAVLALGRQDLASELEEELSRDSWDIGKIRMILRALKLTKSREVIPFIKEKFRTMLPFVRDVVLFIDELKKDGETAFDDFADEIVSIALEPAANRLPVTRAWLLELFGRGSIPLGYDGLQRMASLREPLDMRELILIRNTLRDVNYFRRGKARIDELNDWLKPVFIYGASCLLKDEYKVWIGSIRGRMKFPLDDVFFDWVLEKSRQGASL